MYEKNLMNLYLYQTTIARIYFLSSPKTSGAVSAKSNLLFRPFTIKDVCLAPSAAAARKKNSLTEAQLWWRPKKPTAVRLKAAGFLRTTAESGNSCWKK
jgi:hypothetical protein